MRAAVQKSLRARLARSGHTATVIGNMLVVIGGILRDGGSDTEVFVLRLDSLSIKRC